MNLLQRKIIILNDVLKKQVLFTHEKTPSELSSQGIGWYADLAGLAFDSQEFRRIWTFSFSS